MKLESMTRYTAGCAALEEQDIETIVVPDEFEIIVRDEMAFSVNADELRLQMSKLKRLEKVLSERGYRCVKTKSPAKWETIWKFKKVGGVKFEENQK